LGLRFWYGGWLMVLVFAEDVLSFYLFTFIFCLYIMEWSDFCFYKSDKNLFSVIVVMRLTGKVLTTKTLKHEEEK
jgi:hypothetical protein